MKDTKTVDINDVPQEEQIGNVSYIRIDNICTDYKNPNAMGEDEFARLVESIRSLGFYQPVVVTRSEFVPEIDTDKPFVMVDGYHRMRALSALDYDLVPAIVGSSDLGSATTLALRIALNKNRGQIDLTVAAEQIFELQEVYGFTNDELVATGFSEKEVDVMMQALNPAEMDIDPTQFGSVTISDDNEDPGANPKPFVLEVTFATKEQRNAVRRALKTAGNGDMGVGLLAISGIEE